MVLIYLRCGCFARGRGNFLGMPLPEVSGSCAGRCDRSPPGEPAGPRSSRTRPRSGRAAGSSPTWCSRARRRRPESGGPRARASQLSCRSSWSCYTPGARRLHPGSLTPTARVRGPSSATGRCPDCRPAGPGHTADPGFRTAPEARSRCRAGARTC